MWNLADQPFIDSLHALADQPDLVRHSVHSHLRNLSQQSHPTRTPMVFIRWSLPSFYAHTKKTGDFTLLEAVLNGMVDGINILPEESAPAAGEMLANCAKNQKDSLFEIISGEQDQRRLAEILCGMNFQALASFTSKVLKKDRPLGPLSQPAASGFPLVSFLLSLNPDLVPRIKLMDLFVGLHYTFGSNPRESQAASAIAKQVLGYHLNPTNRSGFRLHLASAPKSDLSALTWAMCSLVDNVGWQPQDITQLGDRRAIRSLEKAVARASKIPATRPTPMPSAERIQTVLSVIRQAALSEIATHKSPPVPTRPAM